MKPVDVKDTPKAFYNFKNKQKAFDLFIYLFSWYVKVYMYYANLFNTLYIEIKCKCYKNSIGQNKCTKISLFFMRAPTHDSLFPIHNSFINWSKRFISQQEGVEFSILSLFHLY